ncbi:MAG: multicopper oxidase domain-containing protein [Candidatus Eremiobacteraeota bacterium]|nr:multicopper oxidase domain-containing protein [Candidatus Eremiobacteraeota bacterium]MBV8594713.1 multicopper oxidase domain-containing protein [Candidatus Eremiobacteraeota bacterium]MBV8669082.1 multicopper oxidase domain-containing protein [Candidatus Eremiobacteraeota bacterium]
MISRRDLLAISGAGGLALATSRALAAMAGASPSPKPSMRPSPPAAAHDLYSKLTTANLMSLPPLTPAGRVTPSGHRRQFTLTIASGTVEPLSGHQVQTMTVNGTSPGPVLRFTEGDEADITVVNQLDQPTSIHWHGIPVAFAKDGTLSQAPIQPGSQYRYTFIAPQAGTYMYHAHYHEMEQDSIIGMIIVQPRSAAREPHYDLDVPLVISSFRWESGRNTEAKAILANAMMMSDMTPDPKADPKPGMGDAMERMDMVSYWGLNGKTFPATAPINVKLGQLVRIRFANVTNMTHPMHLHGHWFRWIAQDGAALAQPQAMNTIAVDPGRTIDIDFIANNPGVWPLHCHVVAHSVDNRDLMAGIVTVVRYEDYSLPTAMRNM